MQWPLFNYTCLPDNKSYFVSVNRFYKIKSFTIVQKPRQNANACMYVHKLCYVHSVVLDGRKVTVSGFGGTTKSGII